MSIPNINVRIQRVKAAIDERSKVIKPHRSICFEDFVDQELPEISYEIKQISQQVRLLNASVQKVQNIQKLWQSFEKRIKEDSQSSFKPQDFTQQYIQKLEEISEIISTLDSKHEAIPKASVFHHNNTYPTDILLLNITLEKRG